MIFKQVKLDPDLLFDLYGKNLVAIENNNVETAILEPLAVQQVFTHPQCVQLIPSQGISGKNKKQFIWLVEEQNFPFLNDTDFLFLTDVLAACKMNMDDIALVNIVANQLTFTELVNQLHPTCILATTIKITGFPIQTIDYKILQYQEFKLCCTDTLESIRLDKTKKTKLWLALKQMLGL